MTLRIYLLFCAALVCVIALSAQEKTPTLTETQKLQLQNASLQVELWQLRTQAAAAEYAKAREAFNTLITSVTPAGWTLNDKLEFVKVVPQKAEPK